MTEFITALLGSAMALAALLPLLRAGGGMIAAFMRRTQVLRYCTATLAQLCGLFGGAFAAMLLAKDAASPSQRLLSAALLLGIVYAVDWAVRLTILKDRAASAAAIPPAKAPE
jgi:hypothetical protein